VTLKRATLIHAEKYSPAMHAAIDWSGPLEWYDKEISQVLGQSGRRNRQVDVLVKVRLCSGGEQWILVHLEIQTSYEEGSSSVSCATTAASSGRSTSGS
jgi:hypothetical protein